MGKFLEAVLLLSGVIIGAGMFGIPFSFVQAGFWLGVSELVVLSGVVLVMHLVYGEIVLHTPTFHRMPGYVRMYLGPRAAAAAWGSALFGIVGTLLAYIVIGGVFLGGIFQHINIIPNSGELPWPLVLAAFGSVIAFFPLRKEAFVNGLLTLLLVGLVILLSVALLPGLNPRYLENISVANAFVPYGILLFALSGGVVIPDVITLLGRSRVKARAAIAVGSLIPAAIYFLFALAVVGASGGVVSSDAIRGLAPIVGEWAVLVGSIIGFLAVITSYIGLHGSFQALLRLDLRIPRAAAWGAASGIPLAFYLVGFRDFITIIGAVGAVAVGVDAALLIPTHNRLRQSSGAALSPSAYVFEGSVYALVSAGVAVYLYQLFA